MDSAVSNGRPVATLAVTTTVGYGVLFYAYGVLLVPMHDDLGWSRSFLTGAFSAALLVGAGLALAIGRWLDTHPPRPLFMIGAALSTVFVAGWAGAHSKVAFVAVWLVLGGCQAVLFYEPAFTVLTKWFGGRERQRAVTTVTLLAGLASTIFGPLTASLEHAFGWRGAALALGVLLGAITVPAFAFGLHAPTRATPQSDPHETADGTDHLPSDALRTRRFWSLTLAYLLSSVTTYAVAVHLVPYLHDRGMTLGGASIVLGAIGLVQVLGRSTFTRLSANRAAVELGAGVLIVKGAGIAFLLAIPGPAGVVLFVAAYGSANGVSTLTRAMSVAELYGARYYGSIASVVAAVSAVGGALAPFLAARAIEIVGDDVPVFWGLAVLSFVAAAVHASVARTKTDTIESAPAR